VAWKTYKKTVKAGEIAEFVADNIDDSRLQAPDLFVETVNPSKSD